MTERYWLLRSSDLVTLNSGDYYWILDRIIYRELEPSQYLVLADGTLMDSEQIHKDVEALRADLADRFDALLA